MCNIENAMANLKDLFVRYMARAVDMFPGSEMAGRAKMLKGLSEIAKLGDGGMSNGFGRNARGVRK